MSASAEMWIGPDEPKVNAMDKLKITINGVELTVGQAMTVHVALQSLGVDLAHKPNFFGHDEHGRFMVKAYLANITTINNLYIE
jgi:hypothetical protein